PPASHSPYTTLFRSLTPLARLPNFQPAGPLDRTQKLPGLLRGARTQVRLMLVERRPDIRYPPDHRINFSLPAYLLIRKAAAVLPCSCEFATLLYYIRKTPGSCLKTGKISKLVASRHTPYS